jgi:hypothetical protein
MQVPAIHETDRFGPIKLRERAVNSSAGPAGRFGYDAKPDRGARFNTATAS